MSDLKREVSLSLDEADVCDILTEALCRYGPMDGLTVTMVSHDAENSDFNLTLEPKPVEATNGN